MPCVLWQMKCKKFALYSIIQYLPQKWIQSTALPRKSTHFGSPEIAKYYRVLRNFSYHFFNKILKLVIKKVLCEEVLSFFAIRYYQVLLYLLAFNRWQIWKVAWLSNIKSITSSWHSYSIIWWIYLLLLSAMTGL